MLTIKLDKKRDGTYWKYKYEVAGEKGSFFIDTRGNHEQLLNVEIGHIIRNLKYTLEITTDENRWD